MITQDYPPLCRHRPGYDRERGEFYCLNCGLVGEDFSRDIAKFNPDGYAMASPSLRNHGLGTDLDGGVRELKSQFHKKETDKADGKELKAIAQDHFMGGAAPRFYDKASDKSLFVWFENELRASGKFTHDEIAAMIEIFRKKGAQTDKEKRKRMKQEMNSWLGREKKDAD